MARHYVKNPADPVPVTDPVLTEARARAEAAAARLRAAEHADPAAPGWESAYEAATASVRATSRRLEALEQLRAAQVERGGQRAAAVKAAQGDLKAMAASLAASRDQVAAAAAEHLRTLAALASAAAEHNARLAESRSKLAATGLRVHDDLVDDGQEHAEGLLEGPGLRAAGTDWTAIPAGGIVAHALRQVFAGEGPMHPLAQAGRYTWRAHEVEGRADGLKVPTLADAGAVAPEPPVRTAAHGAPLSDVLPPRAEVPAGTDVSGHQRAPRGERKTAR